MATTMHKALEPDCRLTRRGFLGAAARTVATSAVALPIILEACGGTAAPAGQAGASGSASAAGGGSGLKLPTYVPFQGPKPDFAGSADGLVQPGYLTYPKTLVKTVTKAFGKGDDVELMMYTTQAPPTPVEQNPGWQQVNKDLGVNIKIPITQLGDYNAKLATVIAGGSLPDAFSLGVGNGAGLKNLPDFLQAQCTDLTPFLAGDAVKDYPNLANIPAYAWKNTVFNGKIYAVPSVRTSILGGTMFAKGKLLMPAGGVDFKNTDEFTARMKQLTVKGQQYGLGTTSGQNGAGVPSIALWFLEVFGAPNVWRESGGKLTKDWETEEFKAAIVYLRSLWDAGVIHPDSPTISINAAAGNFYQGKTALWANGFVIGDVVWNRAHAADPNFDVRAIVPFSHDGRAKPVHHLGNGAFVLAVLKKASSDRIKELLGVLNYLAAPFGSQEALLLKYGAADTDYTMDPKGNPILTKKGQADTFIPWPDIAAAPSVFYDADSEDYVKVMQPASAAIQALGVQNPTVGLYSKTNAEKAAVLNQSVADGLTQIIYGRSDVSTYDQVVAAWRSGGGDQIRSEFEQALQAAR